MSFVNVPGPHYIKRTLVFVDSITALEKSTEGYDFTWALDEALQHVVAIELVQYSLPTFLATTFLGRFDYYLFQKTAVLEFINSNSNYNMDIQVTDISGTYTEIFSLENLGGIYINSNEIVGEYFAGLLTTRFLDGSSPVFIYPTYRSVVSFDVNEVATFKVYHPGTLSFCPVRILNGTGPNRQNQSSIPTGFIPNVDTPLTGPEHDYGAVGTFTCNNTPFLYVDINIKEFPELDPVARIYVLKEEQDKYNIPSDLPNRIRILKQPVKNLKTMRISIRTERDMIPAFVARIGVYLTFELHSIAQVPKVPDWLIQRLSL